MIKREEVAKLAQLARLGISETELDQVGHDLSAILDYVSELKQASAGAGPDLARSASGNAKSGPAPASANSISTEVNVWREDENPYPPGTFRAALLAAAPATQADYFKVKKIL